MNAYDTRKEDKRTEYLYGVIDKTNVLVLDNPKGCLNQSTLKLKKGYGLRKIGEETLDYRDYSQIKI